MVNSMTTDMDKLIEMINDMLIDAYQAGSRSEGYPFKSNLELIRKHQAEQQGVDEGRKAIDFLQRNGFRKCNVAACNCSSWHGGNASSRLKELHELMQEHGFKPYEKTLYKAVEELINNPHPAEPVDLEVCARALWGDRETPWNDAGKTAQNSYKRQAKAVLTAANVKWKE